mmetsp:Transcript_40113/g.119466  ORF Transcript_40113/g.119466 Transcript_40113/m.119466 type:complete len:321 (+) Transcript_40113:2997-3959(+)
MVRNGEFSQPTPPLHCLFFVGSGNNVVVGSVTVVDKGVCRAGVRRGRLPWPPTPLRHIVAIGSQNAIIGIVAADGTRGVRSSRLPRPPTPLRHPVAVSSHNAVSSIAAANRICGVWSSRLPRPPAQQRCSLLSRTASAPVAASTTAWICGACSDNLARPSPPVPWRGRRSGVPPLRVVDTDLVWPRGLRAPSLRRLPRPPAAFRRGGGGSGRLGLGLGCSTTVPLSPACCTRGRSHRPPVSSGELSRRGTRSTRLHARGLCCQQHQCIFERGGVDVILLSECGIHTAMRHIRAKSGARAKVKKQKRVVSIQEVGSALKVC